MPVQLESDELTSIYRQLADVCERLDVQKSFARKQYVELKDNFLKVIRQREANDINDTKQD